MSETKIPSGKTDYEIALELSQTTNKPFFIDTIRKLIAEYDNENISLSKLVEELNTSAYKWQQLKNNPTPEPDQKGEDELLALYQGLVLMDYTPSESRQQYFKRIEQLKSNPPQKETNEPPDYPYNVEYGTQKEGEDELLAFCHFLGKNGYKINVYADQQLLTVIGQFRSITKKGDV